MMNYFKQFAALVAILSFTSCNYPGHSPEKVAKDYVQALCNHNTDAVYETLALPDDLGPITVEVSKEYIKHYMDSNQSDEAYPRTIKGSKVVQKTDIDATVVVYFENQEHKEDTTRVYLINDRKLLRKWYVLDPLTFPFQLMDGHSE